jgi:hypothetical protein
VNETGYFLAECGRSLKRSPVSPDEIISLSPKPRRMCNGLVMHVVIAISVCHSQPSSW